MPQRLQHLKGDIQQVLVEEVHHVLTQAVAPLQRVAGPPAPHHAELRVSLGVIKAFLCFGVHGAQAVSSL